jgi:hypothetical protein
LQKAGVIDAIGAVVIVGAVGVGVDGVVVTVGVDAIVVIDVVAEVVIVVVSADVGSDCAGWSDLTVDSRVDFGLRFGWKVGS